MILRQQTSWSVDLQDHVAANDFQRQPPRSSASKRPAAPRSSASKRPSAATSRILSQHTTFSANLEDLQPANDLQRPLRDPRPANDRQRRPPGSSASERQTQPSNRQSSSKRSVAPRVSANFQDPQPANGLQRQHLRSLASKRHSAPSSWIFGKRTEDFEDSLPAKRHQVSTSRILGKQTTAPTQRILVPQTSLSGTSPNLQRRVPTKRPSRLRLEVLFVSLLIRFHLYKSYLCHHRLI